MLGSQKRGTDFSAGGPLPMLRDRMHQGSAGGGAEYRIDDECFGEARVSEGSLHDSGLVGCGLGIDRVNFATEGFAIHDCYVQQQTSGYSPRGTVGRGDPVAARTSL